MSSQRRFAAALLNPDAPPPAGLLTWNGSDPRQRFAIYRNNVTVSLIEALGATYPVVRQLVGEAFFREMARVYVRGNPPRSAILLGFAETFPEFIEAFEPATGVRYLADVARLELARRQAYHAADEPSLTQSAYAGIAPNDRGLLTMHLHASVTILRSRFAVGSIWAAHQEGGQIETVDPYRAEDVLVLRPDLDVEVLRLAPGVATFLGALAAGATIMDAIVHALDCTAEFDITSALETLIASGAATSLSHPGACHGEHRPKPTS